MQFQHLKHYSRRQEQIQQKSLGLPENLVAQMCGKEKKNVNIVMIRKCEMCRTNK